MISISFIVRRLYSSLKKSNFPLKKLAKNHLVGAHRQLLQYFDRETDRESYYSKYIDSQRVTVPMFNVTTIAHHTDDTRHPLIMVTNREGYKYLFGNIPEGTQRVLNENKVKLGKLKSIFLTGNILSWSQIGGLPGLFLTLSDSTKKSISVFTNSNKLFSYIMATWRYFVFRKGVELQLLDTFEDKIIADSNLAIKPIKIESNLPQKLIDSNLSNSFSNQIKKVTSLMFPRDTSKINSSDPDSYKSDPKDTEIHTHVKLPHPELILPALNQQAVNYIIRFLPIRGKFDPVRAKELGLKPGLNYKLLSEGESVKNDLGQIITPDQVLLKSKSFKKLLILDIPNVNYLSNTLNSTKWFSTDQIGEEEIGLVYHFLGNDIDYKHEAYQNFLNKFPPNCTHIISHPDLANNTLVFKRHAINHLKLKSILNNNYNLPNFENYEPLNSEFDNIFKLQQNQQLLVSTDSISHDDSLIVNESWPEIFDKHLESSKISNKLEIVDTTPISLDIKYETLKDNVQIVTLGTGSAIPSLYRNVIATLLRIPEKANDGIKYKTVLLDGGENTLGTMLRNFGHNNFQQLNQIFQELSLIHLSHLHADHHLGLISIINKWFEVNREKSKILYLVVPWQYDHFINEWYKFEGQLNESVDVSRIEYISCEDFLDSKIRLPEIKQIELEDFEVKYDSCQLTRSIPKLPLKSPNSKLIKKMFSDLNIKSIKTVRALHCAWAYSISIVFNLDETKSFKVSYSGDTRPNPYFAEIGYESDLLIHESSLDNDLIEEALAKKHSTMIEAVTVARLMHCPKLILTHFSSRYSNSANIAVDIAELTRLSKQLQDYLHDSHLKPNIFDSLRLFKDPVLKLEDIEICFAFDMMNVHLKNIDCQMNNFKQILELFVSEELSNDEKKEKELVKQREKREAKRTQRLELKSKNTKQQKL